MRWLTFLALAWLVLGSVLAFPRFLPAQEEGAIPAQAAQPPAAAPAEAPAPAPAGQPQSIAQQNYLAFFFEALGWFYTVAFLGISFVFVALLVMNFLALRREAIVPLQLIEGFEAYLNEKKYQEAYELARSDESFLGKVLSAGLAKLSAGYPQAIEAMQEVGEEETMKAEHRLSYIALIGTISPMVGLLGTVDGMVAAFMVIASRNTTPPPSELAKGISTALITTLVGLWLAIPAIAIYGILKNRLSRMILEAGIVSENLMSRFQTVGKK
jgi:biopolymer transport protein ExbB